MPEERHEPTGTEHVRFYFTGHIPGPSGLVPTWQADYPTGHKVTVTEIPGQGSIREFRVTLWDTEGRESRTEDTDEGYQFSLGRRMIRDALNG